MLTIYLSGPMKGLPEKNKPAFNRLARALRDRGHLVVNPAELEHPEWPGATNWQACLRGDIKAMMDCNTIALMRGWERSEGAHLELHIAHRIGMNIFHVEELLT